MDFFSLCKGKTLKQIWNSKRIEKAKKELRKELQDIIRKWCKIDKKRVIPVYISLKPKIKYEGLYFKKSRGPNSIVIFPIRLLRYPYDPNSSKDFYVVSKEKVLETLCHEYSHHLTKNEIDNKKHGKEFWENYFKVKKRLENGVKL